MNSLMSPSGLITSCTVGYSSGRSETVITDIYFCKILMQIKTRSLVVSEKKKIFSQYMYKPVADIDAPGV